MPNIIINKNYTTKSNNNNLSEPLELTEQTETVQVAQLEPYVVVQSIH